MLFRTRLTYTTLRNLTLKQASNVVFNKAPRYNHKIPRVQQQCRHQTQSSNATGGASDYQLGPSQDVQPQPNTQSWADGGGEDGGGGDSDKGPRPNAKWKQTVHRMIESGLTTSVSLAMLGLAGFGYHKYYKHLVLSKIDKAFDPGDPVLTLAAKGQQGRSAIEVEDQNQEEKWIVVRQEQHHLDNIVSGKTQGHYYLLLGEKGILNFLQEPQSLLMVRRCWKDLNAARCDAQASNRNLIADARKIDGEGVSMFEAHADLEIFRIRLGKALDFEYMEDYIGSLFSIRGPRDTTALLDIERAFNKLEKVAIRRRHRDGKPLVLIINAMHLLRDDDDGNDLLELVQQRAESWAASGLVNMIFNTDDYWIYERLKQYGTRMEVISIRDLPPDKAMAALAHHRRRYFEEVPTREELEEVYKLVGGRMSYLNRVARSKDMIKKCHDICRAEKTWLLNKCGLLKKEMDDDVMDQQKFASAAMVLCKALVDREKELDIKYNSALGHELPELPLYLAREVCTRADFIQQYDHVNIFTIDSEANVRADSVPMAIAMREICNEPGFNKALNETLDRISDIESLGRTRELVMKDLRYEGNYDFVVKNYKGQVEKVITFTSKPGERPDEPDEDETEEDGEEEKK